MATLAQLVVKIVGDTGQLEAALGRAEQKTAGLGGAVGKLGSKMGTALKVGGIAAAAGIGVGVAAMVSFTKQAAEEQVGIERLQTAIKTLDAAHVGSAAAVEKLIQKREKLSFSDDQLRQSLSLLIPATGDYEEAVRRQGIAMDVTRGTGLDLETTSRLLGKVTEESVNVFKRYGITLDKNATETEALAAVQAKFAGQSEAYANTAAGKWERFGNQMDNIKETIGAALLPLVTKLAAKLSDFLTEHQEDIDKYSQLFSEKLAKAIDAVGQALEDAQPQLQAIFANLKAGFEAIKPVLEWVIDNKVAMVAALTAIGVAAVLAFTPVTLPVLGIIAALGALLVVTGYVRSQWADWREDNGLLGATIKGLELEFSALEASVNAIIAVVKPASEFIREHESAQIALKVSIASVVAIMFPFLAAIAAGGVAANVIARAWNGAIAVFDRVVDSIQWVIDRIYQLIEAIDRIPSIGDVVGGIGGKIAGAAKKLNPFASGGFPRAGEPVIVGDQGPEIAAFPGGTRIYSNRESRAMVAGAGGGNVTHVTHTTINVYPQNINLQGDAEAGLASLSEVFV